MPRDRFYCVRRFFLLGAITSWLCGIGALIQNGFVFRDGVALVFFMVGIILWFLKRYHSTTRILRIIRYPFGFIAVCVIAFTGYIVIAMVANLNSLGQKRDTDVKNDRANTAFEKLVELTRSDDAIPLGSVQQKMSGATADSSLLAATASVRAQLFTIMRTPIVMPINAEFKIIGISPHYPTIKKAVVAECIEIEFLYRSGDTRNASEKLEILWSCADMLMQSRMELIGMYTAQEIVSILTEYTDLSAYALKASRAVSIQKSIESIRMHVRSSFKNALDYETELYIRILAEHEKGTLIFLENDVYSYIRKYWYNYAGRWPFFDLVATAHILTDNSAFVMGKLDERLGNSTHKDLMLRREQPGHRVRNSFGEYLVRPLQDYSLFVSSTVRAQSRADLLYMVLYEKDKITSVTDVITGKPFEIVVEGKDRFAQTRYRAGEKKTIPVRMRLR